MIDFHCHLDLYPDRAGVVARAIREGVYVLAVTTTPLAWEGTNALIGTAPRIKVGLGLHPELVRDRHHEVEVLCSKVPEARYIGEIGLDGSPAHAASLSIQQQVLDRILGACEQHGGRIMSLHSRGAASLVLDALERHPAAGRPVLHWFSGSMHELNRAIALGCWFSIGNPMLRAKKGRDLIAAMPRDRLITETDGPFTRIGDLPTMPWEVRSAVSQLCEMWKESADATDRIVHENFRALVDLQKK